MVEKDTLHVGETAIKFQVWKSVTVVVNIDQFGAQHVFGELLPYTTVDGADAEPGLSQHWEVG